MVLRVQVDECDKRVMERASRVQWLAVVFTLVAWTFGISEIYHVEGGVPVVFLNLIFACVLVVSILAQSVGILLG